MCVFIRRALEGLERLERCVCMTRVDVYNTPGVDVYINNRRNS